MEIYKPANPHHLDPKSKYLNGQLVSWMTEDKSLRDIKKNLRKIANDSEQTEAWNVIYRYSLAKINKTCIEQCFAPDPLPDELKQKLNEQIENSRDSLLELLRPRIK